MDTTVRRKLKGRQSNVKYLKDFMMVSIKHGGDNSVEEILSESTPSTPGKGLLSKPEKTGFELTSDWFRGGQAQFKMRRPYHSQKAGWNVQYRKRGEESPIKLNIPKVVKITDNDVTLTMKKSDLSEDAQGATIDEIIVQAVDK